MKKKAIRMEKLADGMMAVGVAMAILMAVCWIVAACTLHVGHPEENGLSCAFLYAGSLCFTVALLLVAASDGVSEHAYELRRKARKAGE